jgi:hypothetical protein
LGLILLTSMGQAAALDPWCEFTVDGRTTWGPCRIEPDRTQPRTDVLNARPTDNFPTVQRLERDRSDPTRAEIDGRPVRQGGSGCWYGSGIRTCIKPR